MKIIKLISLLACAFPLAGHAAGDAQPPLKDQVDSAVAALMKQYNIPGMAVGISVDGKRYFYNYGVASRDSKLPVDQDTLFEIGSISKTFTATLAAYAEVDGKLALSDKASKYLPALRGSSLDQVSLLNLATHTPGGMPLQFPDEVQSDEQVMNYFRQWKPAYAPDTYRTYANPGIGLLGWIAARSMDIPFEDALEKKLFPALGLKHSYIKVPASQFKHYAQGYNSKDAPVRVSPGPLAAEAYGVKTGTGDLLQFLEANMQLAKVDDQWQRAIKHTQTGYFRSGTLTQDLIWEQYAYPVELKPLLAGNSGDMAYHPNPATRIEPALPPQANVLINKTGSTNGFGGYVVFIPAKKTGIVILANKNYPVDARVTTAYQLLQALDGRQASKQ
ncbi:class C beta-lactamase [Janthinobacterium agaricidamnosum]|uniref:Beta-lactamase n=1 Tax=Janthinobacterium agaricidamnosum NBRC 102515 = DSM 9628 TaxID=1349767 RepID=W0V2K2_9BURK|nr:class C beta-lactamase [Janthinobacterium agaricidamnosum]CDG83049.1 beta-lactamase [Janthinobacterium agaricidamnosum NBRC 102515 = DSM 9628]